MLMRHFNLLTCFLVCQVQAASLPEHNPISLLIVADEVNPHRLAGEQRTPLFVTDSGTPRMLGYVLKRSDWNGVVVTYQPGEYQPNALDDRPGPNFHILVNAIYFAAGLAR